MNKEWTLNLLAIFLGVLAAGIALELAKKWVLKSSFEEMLEQSLEKVGK